MHFGIFHFERVSVVFLPTEMLVKLKNTSVLSKSYDAI